MEAKYLKHFKKQIKADQILTELFELEKERMGMYWDEENCLRRIACGSYQSLCLNPILFYIFMKTHVHGMIYEGMGVPLGVKSKKTGKYRTKYLGKKSSELLEIARKWGKAMQEPRNQKEKYLRDADRAMEDYKRYKALAEAE